MRDALPKARRLPPVPGASATKVPGRVLPSNLAPRQRFSAPCGLHACPGKLQGKSGDRPFRRALPQGDVPRREGPDCSSMTTWLAPGLAPGLTIFDMPLCQTVVECNIKSAVRSCRPICEFSSACNWSADRRVTEVSRPSWQLLSIKRGAIDAILASLSNVCTLARALTGLDWWSAKTGLLLFHPCSTCQNGPSQHFA